MAEAQKEADEYVEAKRQRARENAAADVAEAQQEADARAAKAEERAERARHDAEEAVAHAREQMDEARRMADEAAQAAREAADQARERADELAREADERVGEAERRTRAVTEQGRSLAGTADADPLDLDAMHKTDLLDLARDMGIDVNGNQLKKELVTAIRRARSRASA